MTEEEEYKSVEVMSFEDWSREVKEIIKEETMIVHKYTGLYMTTKDAKEREFYNERILEFSNIVAYNCDLLRRGEIERDYLVFYKEDGNLGIQYESPIKRKDIMRRENIRRGFIV